jgi:hypothetical protein
MLNRAFKLADIIHDAVITTLRRDPRFRGVTRDEFDLLLADPLNNAARLLLSEFKYRDRFYVPGDDL